MTDDPPVNAWHSGVISAYVAVVQIYRDGLRDGKSPTVILDEILLALQRMAGRT